MRSEDVKATFTAGLREFARRNGLNQQKLGELMECSQTATSTYLKGKSLPTLDKVAPLLEHGMTLEEIFGREIADKVYSARKTEPQGSQEIPSIDEFMGTFRRVLERMAEERGGKL